MKVRKLPSARAQRWNTWLSALLLLAIVFGATRLVRRHAAYTLDLSEDQLLGQSPALLALLDRLEDVLAVQVYATGEMRHGAAQIAKGRLFDQLRELERAGGGRVRVSYADPASSSEARVEAERAGIVAVPLQGVQGTARVSQNIYLGLVLRYTGREQVLPFALPQRFEAELAEALSALLRAQPPVVGLLVEGAAGEGSGGAFTQARALLGRRALVREVRGLARGRAVPEEIELLIAIAPERLEPRAVWEIEQYARRGGRVLLLLERLAVDTAAQSVRAVDTGLEPLLRRWGAPLSWALLWDFAANSITLERGTSAAGAPLRDTLAYPYWVRVAEAGLAREFPPTARLSGADFFWSSALGSEVVEATDWRRTELVRSSPRSYFVEPPSTLAIESSALDAQGVGLLAGGAGEPAAIAVLLEGMVPGEAGAAPPASGAAAVEELTPAPAPRATNVVVFADADWVRDGTFSERNQMLWANLVDWLTLEGELVAIRSRVPRERPIRDFLEEERARRGLAGLGGSASAAGAPGAIETSRAEGEAARAAARTRWLAMGAASGAALLAIAACVLATRAWRGGNA